MGEERTIPPLFLGKGGGAGDQNGLASPDTGCDKRIRIVIADEQPVVRLGLRACFGTVPHFEIVGEAGAAAEAIVEAQRLRPDVVVIGLRFPDGSGVDACQEICARYPAIRVVILMSLAEESLAVASIKGGASAVLLKQSSCEHLIEAVDTVGRGGLLLDPMIAQVVVSWLQRWNPVLDSDALAVLSKQERRVLPLVAEGKTNREIADILSLSEHTVKTHVSNILQKLGLTRRSEVAAFLIRLKETGARSGFPGRVAPTGKLIGGYAGGSE